MKSSLQCIRWFLLGCLISTLSFFALFFIAYSNEVYFFNSSINFVDIFESAVYCAFIAIVEEFLFRYLFLKKWIKDKKKKLTNRVFYLGLMSSILFGFLHFNLDEFPLMQINLMLSGISLFFATYLFRDISIAVGMHFSWNLIQGVIFPFEGSGANINSLLVFENEVNIIPEASPFMFTSFFVEIIFIWTFYKIKSKRV